MTLHALVDEDFRVIGCHAPLDARPERLERLDRLDRRATSYRFDLETDPCWSRADEPGEHAPPGLLRDLGIDPVALGEDVHRFDWVFGAAVCRAFSLLESWVADFEEHERGRLRPSRSLSALMEEERKHIALFDRYAELLLARHDRELFERCWAPTRRRLQQRYLRMRAQPDPAARHHGFWLNLLFFEEVTVYIDARMEAERDRVQPLWRSVHRLHRIEEVQHIVTDEAYLGAIHLEPARRDELSRYAMIGNIQIFHDVFGLAPALASLAELGKRDVHVAGRLTARPIFRALLTSPIFRRTRAAVPGLAGLLGS